MIRELAERSYAGLRALVRYETGWGAVDEAAAFYTGDGRRASDFDGLHRVAAGIRFLEGVGRMALTAYEALTAAYALGSGDYLLLQDTLVVCEAFKAGSVVARRLALCALAFAGKRRTVVSRTS